MAWLKISELAKELVGVVGEPGIKAAAVRNGDDGVFAKKEGRYWVINTESAQVREWRELKLRYDRASDASAEIDEQKGRIELLEAAKGDLEEDYEDMRLKAEALTKKVADLEAKLAEADRKHAAEVADLKLQAANKEAELVAKVAAANERVVTMSSDLIAANERVAAYQKAAQEPQNTPAKEQTTAKPSPAKEQTTAKPSPAKETADGTEAPSLDDPEAVKASALEWVLDTLKAKGKITNKELGLYWGGISEGSVRRRLKNADTDLKALAEQARKELA